MSEGSLAILRELLGHSDLKTTLRYAHLAPDVKAEAVRRMTQMYANVVPFNHETKQNRKDAQPS